MQNISTFLSKILDQPSSQSQSSQVFRFIPQIKISSKSTLHLQIQPKDPHTASNIVVNAFQSKTNRTLVPIKIQWSRYKFRSDQQFTIEKIPAVVGNTYMCEPSDLGSVIQAKVKCLDPMISGEAEATIGPIRIDPMLKRLIDGALYSESLLSQVIIVEGEEKFNVNLRLTKNTMEFTEINTSQKLTMPYTLSQPKIQLSPKDPCKVYLRFEQDTANTVRSWLDRVTGGQGKGLNPNAMNESSMSIRVPHSNSSSMTSKTKLFQQRPSTHCTNKLSTRFLSRNSRDLFLFTLRAFICKQDMRNSIILQRLQTLQTLKTQQDYDKFLEFISLKSQIIRLAEIAKQLQQDRDSKVRDISNMQESISEMTLTYLKIIEEKSQQQHVDLEQSYSMISMKREEILGRRNLREMKEENEKLKGRIRELNEQVELNRFFSDKREANEQSMLFNQTSNPFQKKPTDPSSSYYIPQPKPTQPTHKNMLQISKSYMKVLQENKKLKERSVTSKRGSQHDQSMGIENLLESLHDQEEGGEGRRVVEMRQRVQVLKDQLQRVNELNTKLSAENAQLKLKLTSSPQSSSYPYPTSTSPTRFNQSMISNTHNNTSLISQSHMSMNQSMTSQAQLGLLQKKLIQLSNINAKFETENARLRRERDYFRGLYDAEVQKGKVVPSRDVGEDSNLLENDCHDTSYVVRLKEDKEKLQNQRNALVKKIESLTRESNSNLSSKSPDPTTNQKHLQLLRQHQNLSDENDTLKKTIENMKSFHQLQKREWQQGGGSRSSSSSKDVLQVKEEEIDKLKKVNGSLLGEIKELRMEIERRNDANLANSRVLELENQLNVFRTYAKGGSNSGGSGNSPYGGQSSSPLSSQQLTQQRMIEELTSLRKENQRLKQEISTLQKKISTQTITIQKLMTQLDQLHQNNQNTSGVSNSFNKKYLTTPNGENSPQQLQKYKKKLSQLQAQLTILRRNSQAVNRSRDLSMSMMGYQQERLQLYKKENESLMLEIENLNKMCSKYSRDAREANMELNKLREKMVVMNKERLEVSG